MALDAAFEAHQTILSLNPEFVRKMKVVAFMVLVALYVLNSHMREIFQIIIGAYHSLLSLFPELYSDSQTYTQVSSMAACLGWICISQQIRHHVIHTQ